MEWLDGLRTSCRISPGRVVLADGVDLRSVTAADYLLRERLVSEIILLGDPDAIHGIASENGLDLSRAVLIDPRTSPERKELSTLYRERHHNRIPPEQAWEEIAMDLNFGAALVRQGRADGLVGGADHPTADLIRSAWWVIGMKEGVKTLSSSFLMLFQDHRCGAAGAMLFADCAVVARPNPHQLADIAEDSARQFKALTGVEPVVGFLSFSTKGSAQHADVEKVRTAVAELARRKPDFIFDGEMQFDAAILPRVAGVKAPGSPAAGRVNVLIFPDLDAGNLSYKVAERLGGARAIGPLLQGTARPVSDLSRGCSWQDIADVCVVTRFLQDRCPD